MEINLTCNKDLKTQLKIIGDKIITYSASLSWKAEWEAGIRNHSLGDRRKLIFDPVRIKSVCEDPDGVFFHSTLSEGKKWRQSYRKFRKHLEPKKHLHLVSQRDTPPFSSKVEKSCLYFEDNTRLGQSHHHFTLCDSKYIAFTCGQEPVPLQHLCTDLMSGFMDTNKRKRRKPKRPNKAKTRKALNNTTRKTPSISSGAFADESDHSISCVRQSGNHSSDRDSDRIKTDLSRQVNNTHCENDYQSCLLQKNETDQIREKQQEISEDFDVLEEEAINSYQPQNDSAHDMIFGKKMGHHYGYEIGPLWEESTQNHSNQLRCQHEGSNVKIDASTSSTKLQDYSSLFCQAMLMMVKEMRVKKKKDVKRKFRKHIRDLCIGLEKTSRKHFGIAHFMDSPEGSYPVVEWVYAHAPAAGFIKQSSDTKIADIEVAKSPSRIKSKVALSAIFNGCDFAFEPPSNPLPRFLNCLHYPGCLSEIRETSASSSVSSFDAKGFIKSCKRIWKEGHTVATQTSISEDKKTGRTDLITSTTDLESEINYKRGNQSNVAQDVRSSQEILKNCQYNDFVVPTQKRTHTERLFLPKSEHLQTEQNIRSKVTSDQTTLKQLRKLENKAKNLSHFLRPPQYTFFFDGINRNVFDSRISSETLSSQNIQIFKNVNENTQVSLTGPKFNSMQSVPFYSVNPGVSPREIIRTPTPIIPNGLFFGSHLFASSSVRPTPSFIPVASVTGYSSDKIRSAHCVPFHINHLNASGGHESFYDPNFQTQSNANLNRGSQMITIQQPPRLEYSTMLHRHSNSQVWVYRAPFETGVSHYSSRAFPRALACETILPWTPSSLQPYEIVNMHSNQDNSTIFNNNFTRPNVGVGSSVAECSEQQTKVLFPKSLYISPATPHKGTQRIRLYNNRNHSACPYSKIKSAPASRNSSNASIDVSITRSNSFSDVACSDQSPEQHQNTETQDFYALPRLNFKGPACFKKLVLLKDRKEKSSSSKRSKGNTELKPKKSLRVKSINHKTKCWVNNGSPNQHGLESCNYSFQQQYLIETRSVGQSEESNINRLNFGSSDRTFRGNNSFQNFKQAEHIFSSGSSQDDIEYLSPMPEPSGSGSTTFSASDNCDGDVKDKFISSCDSEKHTLDGLSLEHSTASYSLAVSKIQPSDSQMLFYQFFISFGAFFFPPMSCVSFSATRFLCKMSYESKKRSNYEALSKPHPVSDYTTSLRSSPTPLTFHSECSSELCEPEPNLNVPPMSWLEWIHLHDRLKILNIKEKIEKRRKTLKPSTTTPFEGNLETDIASVQSDPSPQIFNRARTKLPYLFSSSNPRAAYYFDEEIRTIAQLENDIFEWPTEKPIRAYLRPFKAIDMGIFQEIFAGYSNKGYHSD